METGEEFEWELGDGEGRGRADTGVRVLAPGTVAEAVPEEGLFTSLTEPGVVAPLPGLRRFISGVVMLVPIEPIELIEPIVLIVAILDILAPYIPLWLISYSSSSRTSEGLNPVPR